jgi:peptidyl-prolyl cis-trans isomerase D
MLKALRDNLKYLSWILWIVIATFVAAIFFDFGGLTGGLAAPTDSAATVAGKPVTFREYEQRYRSLEQQYRQMLGPQFTPEMAEQFGLQRQALESLINQRVLLLEAERLGLAVSDEELRQAVLEIPGFAEDGRFIGRERYEQALRGGGYSAESFEQALREELLLEKMNQVLSQTLYVSDGEVERAFREQSERAQIRYLLLPDTQLAGEATASRGELERHLAEHAEDFRLPEQRRVALLLVDGARVAQEVKPSLEELEAWYREHEDEFRGEEEVTARHILLRTGGERTAEQAAAELAAARARIEAGEPFAAVAREVSEDPGSAARGGDLGSFGRGAMVPEFEQAAFGARPGELVGPVESPFGVHLLEVTAHRGAGVRPFAEARAEVAQRVRSEQATARARQIATEVAAELAQGDGGVAAMQRAAAARPAVDFQQPPPLGREGMVPGLGRSEDLAAAAFALSPGGVSEVIEVPRGFAVLRVEEALPPRVPELAEIEPQVRRAVEQEKRRQAALARLEQVKRQVAGGASLADAAGELGVEVAESGEFSASGSIEGLGVVPEVARAAMAAAEGDLVGPLSTPRGAILFRVTARTRFDPSELATRREEIRQGLVEQRAVTLRQALLLQRREELGVSINRQVAEDLQGAPES